MGNIKRGVDLPSHLKARFARISKADWAEIALDMYCEYRGGTEDQFMTDAERRLEIIKAYRRPLVRPKTQ
jgi:hypothetical protein